MATHEKKTESDYRFFCRNCLDMITMDACLKRRGAAADTQCSSCAGCSKDTLITRTSRGMFHNPGSAA